jgi:tetratricopeptide (TPR) repeat protein
VAFANLRYTPGDPSIAPRLARWQEIQGNADAARKLLGAALSNVMHSSNVPAEQKAWFWLRVGDIELRSERFRAADSAYLNGLKAHPDDYRLLSALARSALMQGRNERATVMGEKAIAATLDPATLGTLSDAWAARGDSARSAEYADALDVSVRRQPGAYHRAWSLFLLDHDRHLDAVTRKIRDELRTRQDIYGWDLLAWALHKQGRDAQAADAMRHALALGTRDPLLRRHAAEIDNAMRQGQ